MLSVLQGDMNDSDVRDFDEAVARRVSAVRKMVAEEDL